MDERMSKKRREWVRMFSLGQCIYEDGLKEGIKALIQSNMSNGISRERTIENLKQFFGLTEEKSEKYYEQFASEM